jgi:hypothetical protein
MSIDNKYIFYFVVGFCIMDVLFALISGNFAYIVIFASLIFLTSFYLEERTLILIVSYFIASIIEHFGHKYITFFKKE